MMIYDFFFLFLGGMKLYKPTSKLPLLDTPKETRKEPELPKIEDFKPIRPVRYD